MFGGAFYMIIKSPFDLSFVPFLHKGQTETWPLIIRGEDLDIDLTKEIEMICSKTGMKVIYTGDATKYAEP